MRKKPYLFIFLFLSSISLKGQYEFSQNFWIDKNTITHHKDIYLGNLFAGLNYYVQWDSTKQCFISSLPSLLTYKPAANTTVIVESFEIGYTDRYHIITRSRFNAQVMDSVINRSKKQTTAILEYDSVGRLTSNRLSINSGVHGKEKRNHTVSYKNDNYLSEFTLNLEGPKWTNTYVYKLNPKTQIESVQTTYDNKKNPQQFIYTYAYDQVGRTISSTKIPAVDSLRDIRYHQYKEEPFNLDSLQLTFELFKIPSIQHWLSNQYSAAQLKIISYERYESNANRKLKYIYVVDHNHNKLLMVAPYPAYFMEKSDSNSISKVRCGISRSQNLMDTIPYDPHFKPQYIETVYSDCSVEEKFSRPHGLVNASGIEYYKRSIHPLPNGWTLITYQRGSNGSTSFVPGYFATTRLDVRFDEHLILDNQNRVRYIIAYDEIFKLEYQVL